MDLIFALSVIFTGVVIVFIVLIVLIGVMMLLGKFSGVSGGGKPSGGEKNAPPAAVSAPAPKAPPQLAVQSGIRGEVVAAIAAAVSALTGGSGKPVSIRRTSGKAPTGARSAWSLAGLHENTQPF